MSRLQETSRVRIIQRLQKRVQGGACPLGGAGAWESGWRWLPGNPRHRSGDRRLRRSNQRGWERRGEH